jgi:predicted lipoprotein with Yx(FWY)xxD motif
MVSLAGRLYVFDKDSGGKSPCGGPCAANWPPLAAAAGAMPMGRRSGRLLCRNRYARGQG